MAETNIIHSSPNPCDDPSHANHERPDLEHLGRKYCSKLKLCDRRADGISYMVHAGLPTSGLEKARESNAYELPIGEDKEAKPSDTKITIFSPKPCDDPSHALTLRPDLEDLSRKYCTKPKIHRRHANGSLCTIHACQPTSGSEEARENNARELPIGEGNETKPSESDTRQGFAEEPPMAEKMPSAVSAVAAVATEVRAVKPVVSVFATEVRPTVEEAQSGAPVGTIMTQEVAEPVKEQNGREEAEECGWELLGDEDLEDDWQVGVKLLAGGLQ